MLTDTKDVCPRSNQGLSVIVVNVPTNLEKSPLTVKHNDIVNRVNKSLNRVPSVTICQLYDDWDKSQWASNELGSAEFNHLDTYDGIIERVFDLCLAKGVKVESKHHL